MVRCRLGRIVEEPAESSDSESPESSDSDDEESWFRASIEPRTGIGAFWKELVRSWAFSKESDRDGGRKSTGEGVGEFAVLRRAAISRNAATEILWDVSEATLFPLGRGMAGGTKVGPDKEESGDGDSGRTCRNDLRLNESVFTSTLSVGAVSAVLDFLRSLCAHEKSPPCFLGADGNSALVRVALFPISLLVGGGLGWLGSDRVESAPLGSPNRLLFSGGGRMSSRSASERELGAIGIGGGRKAFASVTSAAGVDRLRKPR
jgi:hypothetical protein